MQTWLSTEIETTAASEILVIVCLSVATGKNSRPVTNMACAPGTNRILCLNKYSINKQMK